MCSFPSAYLKGVAWHKHGMIKMKTSWLGRTTDGRNRRDCQYQPTFVSLDCLFYYLEIRFKYTVPCLNMSKQYHCKLKCFWKSCQNKNKVFGWRRLTGIKVNTGSFRKVVKNVVNAAPSDVWRIKNNVFYPIAVGLLETNKTWLRCLWRCGAFSSFQSNDSTARQPFFIIMRDATVQLCCCVCFFTKLGQLIP